MAARTLSRVDPSEHQNAVDAHVKSARGIHE
jgi:hypothetical protein